MRIGNTRGLAFRALSNLLLAVAPVAAQTSTEDFKLTASDAGANDIFGQAVAVSGTTAIVGAYGEDGFVGAAYVFEASTGQQLFKLTASDAAAGDAFGFSVAVSGSTAIVGAPLHDASTGINSGAAYVFDTTTGQQLFKLTASDAAAGDEFGTSVAISGTRAIVGAPLGGDAGVRSGSAYIFDTTTGQQLSEFIATDMSAGDLFGADVAIAGNAAVIGARNVGVFGIRIGSAYIFDTSTGQQLFQLLASDGKPNDSFGSAVAISGDTAVIGSIHDNGITGSAYVFNTTTGDQLFKLTAPDAAGADAFGQSVAISGTTAVVGARFDVVQGQVAGSAYAFDTTTGQRLLKLTTSDATSLNRFGTSVAISGSFGIVGAPGTAGNGPDSGSAYVFIRPPEITSQPRSVLVSPGETAVLSVSVTNPGVRDFHWRRDGVELSNGPSITGAWSPTLQIVVQPSDEALYDCVISNPVSITTDPVVIAVRPDPNACSADLAAPFGLLNFFDIVEYINQYNAGCP